MLKTITVAALLTVSGITFAAAEDLYAEAEHGSLSASTSTRSTGYDDFASVQPRPSARHMQYRADYFAAAEHGSGGRGWGR
jgi:hypothetical protein